MAQEELPNGFTGFAHKKAGFVSAADAIRQGTRSASVEGAVSPAASGARSTSATQAQNPAQTGSFQYARDHADIENDDRPAVPFDMEAINRIPDPERRWAWLEIDLSAIRHNVVETKRRLKSGVRLCAVVKADAYGHGAVRVAKTALNSGADYLAVATVPEAIELREAGLTAPLLVLAQPPKTSIPLLLGYNIMPTIYDAEFAIAYGEEADAHGVRAPYHMAVNTGMNRIGVRYDDVVEFARNVSFHRALDLVGVFTHFATADCPETLDFQIQVKRFMEAIDCLRMAGVNPGIVHAANSAAIFRYPEVHFDMVRLGISLYGFHACPETRSLVELRPAMSVHARVTDARLVPMSEGVSYGLNYRSPGSVQICTVGVGYADGLNRALSGRTDFLVDGHRFHQVGNICMDQCMFEVDLRSYGTRMRVVPQPGDEVIIVGKSGNEEVTIDEMAAELGTIQHEIAIAFSHRMPRIYL